MEETSHTTAVPAAAASQTPDGDPTASAPPDENAAKLSADAAVPGQSTAPDENTPSEEVLAGSPGFRERGRMRRRVRFLRKARELAYRDLGGLVFDLHRFGHRNDTLVLAKLDTIGRIDGELRALEASLEERQPVTVLREAGVAACPRCAAIHGSDDRFCPNCGLAMDLRAERPMAGPAAPSSPTTPQAPTPASAPPAPPAPATVAHTSQPPTPLAPSTPSPSSPSAPSSPAGATPALAPPSPASPAPAPRTTQPAGPAPAIGDSEAKTRDPPQPQVDQPTEILRPPAKSP